VTLATFCSNCLFRFCEDPWLQIATYSEPEGIYHQKWAHSSIVPAGTGAIFLMIPGTSRLATIVLSLRDLGPKGQVGTACLSPL
jgi:hypothetical protein